MAQGGSNGDHSNDKIYQILALIGIPILAVVLIWVYAKPAVLFLLYAINIIQYAPLYYLNALSPYSTGIFLHCVDTMRWYWAAISLGYFPHGASVPHGVIDPATVTVENLKIVQADIGSYMLPLYPLAVGMIWYKVQKNMLGDRLRRRFSLAGGGGMLSFMEYQSREWTPTLFLKIFDHNKRTYADDAPMRVMEFLRLNKIRLTRDQGLDEAALEALMVSQIGTPWRGFKHEPFYIQAALLMAMVTLQLDEAEMNDVRSRLDRAFYAKLPKDQIEARVRAIIDDVTEKEPELVTVINEVASSHAYTSTVVLAVFGYCGPFRHWGGGFGPMIPPPTYMWLMRYSRTLYLAMEGSIGRHGIICFVEAAGIISHFQWEKMTGKPKTRKYATQGVEGVKTWLEKHKVKDMAEFEKARKSGLRRYKDRRAMEAAEMDRITRILEFGKAS